VLTPHSIPVYLTVDARACLRMLTVFVLRCCRVCASATQLSAAAGPSSSRGASQGHTCAGDV
jgi:hypothetical protein